MALLNPPSGERGSAARPAIRTYPSDQRRQAAASTADDFLPGDFPSVSGRGEAEALSQVYSEHPGIEIAPPDPVARSHADPFAAQSGRNAQHAHLIASSMEAARAVRPMSDWTRIKLASVITAIRAGAGQGRGDNFAPWLRIRRNFSSPVSHQVAESVGINARNHHFLSKLEFHTAILIAYLGASSELREGLPMWPFEHYHPGAHLGSTRIQPRRVPGLLEIARDAGISHGCFVGTKVPYIGTIDQMHTTAYTDQGAMLLGVSCKPAALVHTSERNRERLELDRRYCQVTGALHVIEYGLDFKTAYYKLLLKQLRDFKPLTSEIRKHRGTQRLLDFAGNFERSADAQPVGDAACLAGAQVGLDRAQSYLFFRVAAWTHLVDIDFSQPLQMEKPIKRGAGRVLDALRARYFGGSHV